MSHGSAAPVLEEQSVRRRPAPLPGPRHRRARGPWRRRLARLAGALFVAAFVGAGAFGVVRYIETFWLYRGFPPPTDLREIRVGTGASTREVPVTPGALTSFSLVAGALGGYRDHVLVYLPPGYDLYPARHYPVLYLLHGFPGDAQGFVDIGDVATTMDDLLATGRILPMILVMPNGARGFFQDQEWADSVNPGNHWETFVASELVGAVDSRYRTLRSGSDRGIAGDSEGAYGAINISLHHPGEFDLVEGWSPYYNADTNRSLFGTNAKLITYNSPRDEIYEAAPALRKSHTYIWLYGGTDDYTNKGSLLFIATLSRLGVAHAYAVHHGRHNWFLWRSQMPNALATAAAYFAHGRPPA